jgi:hypothetical protein
MSRLTGAIQGFERFGDHCNAILVKEVRQALKSRQFIVTFMLLLLVSWGGSMFGVAYEGDSIEYGVPAQKFFVGFFMVLCVACLIVVPFSTFRSIVEERTENTMELLQITTLAPRQIVWGKLLSSLVQVLVYYSAIAPFIAFTSLLQGFDFVEVGVSLGMLLLVSIFFSMLALTIGAATRQKAAHALVSMVILGASLAGMGSFVGMIMDLGMRVDLRDPNTWWFGGFLLTALCSFIYLGQAIAVANLTFEADNRSTGIRLTVFGQWLAWWICPLLYGAFHRNFFSQNGTSALLTVAAIYIGIAGFVFTSESNAISRRVRRSFPRSTLLRLLSIPFLPGGSRGLCFVLLTLCVPPLVVAGWTARRDGWNAVSTFVDINVPWVLSLYILIYTNISTLLARSMRKAWRGTRSSHIFVMTTFVVVFGMIIPYIPKILQKFPVREFSLFDTLSPALTLDEVGHNRPSTNLAFIILGGTAGALLLINLRALIAGIRDVVQSPLLPSSSRPGNLPSEIAVNEAALMPLEKVR